MFIKRCKNVVIFVENYNGVLPILKKNLKFKNINNYKIIENDIYEFMLYYQKLKNKFDIIFLDPPYKDKNIKNFNKIKKKKILNKNGIIIIT